jgi:hypothetical protein
MKMLKEKDRDGEWAHFTLPSRDLLWKSLLKSNLLSSLHSSALSGGNFLEILLCHVRTPTFKAKCLDLILDFVLYILVEGNWCTYSYKRKQFSQGGLLLTWLATYIYRRYTLTAVHGGLSFIFWQAPTFSMPLSNWVSALFLSQEKRILL